MLVKDRTLEIRQRCFRGATNVLRSFDKYCTDIGSWAFFSLVMVKTKKRNRLAGRGATTKGLMGIQLPLAQSRLENLTQNTRFKRALEFTCR